MQEPADQPAKHGRSLTGFYIALSVVVALGLFGVWFWRAYTVWWFDADEAKRRQAEVAAKRGVPVEKSIDLGGGVTLDLVLIPAGRFKMGTSVTEKDRYDNETQHWVVLTRPFYIGKYEVTQEVWEKVMGANPSEFKDAKNPVETIGWDDCQEFLRKLNALGKEPGLFRIPSEAEWEWACRAGTKTPFYFGDSLSDLADHGWYGDNSGGRAHPVGGKKPNAWGLFDCYGNVWEWTGDWWEQYSRHRWCETDPTGPATGDSRAMRGGAYNYAGKDCRSALGSSYPGLWRGSVGLRVVMVPAGH